MTEVSQIAKDGKKNILKTPEEEFSDLLVSLDTYIPNQDRSIVRKAFEYASELHKDQTRRSGEAYITHPVAVANIVSTLKLDTASVVAAILHDTVEDTSATLKDIESLHGPESHTLSMD